MAMVLAARRASASVAAAARPMSTAVFANYSAFDGDMVMNLRPAFPRFSKREYGWGMARRGGVALEFSKRKESGGPFDWANRATFVLDLPEIGEIAVDQTGELKFVHNVKRPDGSQLSKELTVVADAASRTITFTLAYGGEDPADFTVTVSEGNFFVMKSLMVAAIPQLSGWAMVLDPNTFHEDRHAERNDRE